MTRFFCDWCGKEHKGKDLETWNLSLKVGHAGPVGESFVVCRPCALGAGLRDNDGTTMEVRIEKFVESMKSELVTI